MTHRAANRLHKAAPLPSQLRVRVHRRRVFEEERIHGDGRFRSLAPVERDLGELPLHLGRVQHIVGEEIVEVRDEIIGRAGKTKRRVLKVVAIEKCVVGMEERELRIGFGGAAARDAVLEGRLDRGSQQRRAKVESIASAGELDHHGVDHGREGAGEGSHVWKKGGLRWAGMPVYIFEFG